MFSISTKLKRMGPYQEVIQVAWAPHRSQGLIPEWNHKKFL